MAIKLFSGVVIKAALDEVVSIFEAESGISVETRYDLNPAVKTRIEGGEAFDVVVTNPHFIDDLVADGKVSAVDSLDIGTVEMGLAVEEGSNSPSFSSMAEFKDFLLKAPSISYAAEGTSGKTFRGVLHSLGLLDEITPRLRPSDGGQSMKYVKSGEVFCAALPKSIILATPGVKLAGLFPSELKIRIQMTAGLSAGASHDARKLLAFLAGPSIDKTLADAGIDRLS